MKKIISVAAAAALGLSLAACDTASEEATDEAVDTMEAATDEAADTMEEATEEAPAE